MDAVLHRYGGDLRFFDSWTWEETVAFLPKVLQFAAEDLLRLRWFIRYEEAYPKFEDFKKALTQARPAPKKKIEDIVTDSLKLIGMDWRSADGKRD